MSKLNFYKEKNIKLDEKLLNLKLLEEERDSLAEKNKDLEDEVSEKDQEIDILKETLAEELDNAQNRIIKCVPCDYKSHSFQSLSNHTARSHDCSSIKIQLKVKLNKIKDKVNEQKVKLTSTLFKLKEKENFDKQKCICRNFCRIYHYRHNWKRSTSTEIFLKMKKFNHLNIEQVPGMKENQNVQSDVNCECCDKAFGEINELKKHIGTTKNRDKLWRREKWGNVILFIEIPLLTSRGIVKDY